jgi:hypothetical protein
MPDAITLIVLVAAGDAGGSVASAVTKAAREALGPGAHVVVREAHPSPADAEALAVERAESCEAVAELAWADPKHRDASLRVHVARTGRWLERTIEFRSFDADSERGRTLGFAIASMVPQESAPGHGAAAPTTKTEGGENASSDSPLRSASTSAERPPASAADVVPPGPREVPTTPTRPAETPRESPEALAPALGLPQEGSTPAPPSNSTGSPANSSTPRHNLTPRVELDVSHGDARTLRGRFAIDMLATGAPSAGGGYGIAVSAQARILPLVSLRVGGGFRQGEPVVTSLDDTYESTTWMGLAGAVVVMLRPTRRLPVGASAHADYLQEHETLTPPANPFAPSSSSQGHWVHALDAVLDASFLLLDDVEAVVGGGVEASLDRGESIVVVGAGGGPASYSLPWMRAVGEAGIRLRF